MLFEGLATFCSLKSSEDWSRGRKTLLQALHSISSSFTPSSIHNNNTNSVQGNVNVSLQRISSTVARPVDPNIVPVPEQAGTCDPMQYLSPERRSVLRDLKRLVEPESE